MSGNTDKSLSEKVTEACHRIEELYYETDGRCYVSFSGGKDSTVILSLVKNCEDILTIPVGGIPAVFGDTGIELGVTKDFVKWVGENWYKNVIVVRPEVSFDWVLKNKGKPMLSKIKSQHLKRWHHNSRTEALNLLMLHGRTLSGGWTTTTKIPDKNIHMLSDDFPIEASPACCDYLKKAPIKKWAHENNMIGSINGMRVAEGGIRALSMKKRVKLGDRPCTVVSGEFINKMPIIDWSDQDLEDYIKLYDVPLSDAYTKYGFERTGCMACPFSRDIDNDLKYLYEHEPNRYKAAMHWLKDVYIAQDVVLPFDEEYEREREKMWRDVYEPMRQEMLRKYRPNSKLLKDGEQLTLFD